jgi:hypothetical protein
MASYPALGYPFPLLPLPGPVPVPAPGPVPDLPEVTVIGSAVDCGDSTGVCPWPGLQKIVYVIGIGEDGAVLGVVQIVLFEVDGTWPCPVPLTYS